MASQNQKDALFAWLNTLGLSKQVTSHEDLCDGILLFEVLTDIDANLFRPLRQPAADTTEDEKSRNWVLWFNHLKRMYKLMVHYFEETLNLSTTTLIQPNLQLIAKDYDEFEVVQLTSVILALAVQSYQNKKHVGKIQELEEWAQRELMGCIETVMQTVSDKDAELDESSALDDSRNNDSIDSAHLVEANTSTLSSKLATVQAENETLTTVYEDLLKQHNALREDYEDVVRNLSSAEEKVEQAAAASSSNTNNDRTESSLKAEVDRLRTEWQKAENRADENESQIEKLQNSLSDMTRKVGDLQVKADQADSLVDQVDELRHTAEKLQKAENVIEKYKRKLDEGADLRRSIKTLEEQNSNLVDRNSEIEEEYKKVSAFKSLMDSYKKKMDEFETKNGELAKELETLKFDLNKKSEEAKIIQEEKAKQDEALELYEARVKELELETGGRKASKGGADDEDEDEGQVEDELQDAMEGTTMTDLKIQVRKLKRDLQDAQANKADGSRIVVLENLLEDSSRMKAKYEVKYLDEHREKLGLMEQLEQIRSGKSDFSDGPESAIALRKRLAEVIDELDKIKTDYNKLSVSHEHTQKELLIAQSDLKLVNKDQLDVLATLRASVATEKEALEAQVLQLKQEKQDLHQNNTMQLSQINTLLREKIGMQTDTITQREMLLSTERDISKLKVSLAGKGLTDEDQARFTQITDQLTSVVKEKQILEEKLQQATDIIEQKDQLFREQQAGALLVEESRQGESVRIQQLEEEVVRYKNELLELEPRYRKEGALILGAVKEEGLRRVRESTLDATRRSSSTPSSWLGRQRSRGAGKVFGMAR